LKSDAQPFSEFSASHRPVQHIEQTAGAGARKAAIAPNSIRNSFEATRSSESREMPPIDFVVPGKAELPQCF
jgi:hypothetical protein